MQHDDDSTPPDFHQPGTGRRRVEVNGKVYYLPRGITRHPSGRWRTTVKNKGRYFKSLRWAWRDLVKRQQAVSPHRVPSYNGPRRRIDTGVIGLQVKVDCKPQGIYVRVTVAQSLVDGYRDVPVGNCRLDRLTQSWLDEKLRVGAATRWHYRALRDVHGQLEVVTPDAVPVELVPDKPMKAVTVDDVSNWALEKVNRSGTRKGTSKS